MSAVEFTHRRSSDPAPGLGEEVTEEPEAAPMTSRTDAIEALLKICAQGHDNDSVIRAAEILLRFT